MPSLNTFRSWFKAGIEQGATHMLVISDMFSHESYPIYVMPDQDPGQVAALYEPTHEHYAGNLQKLMEVYNLSLSLEDQLSEERACHY